MGKEVIRSSVWETNSSSCHALAILKPKPNDYYTREEIMDDIYLWNGKIRLYDFELQFGRSPFRTLGTFESKLGYAVANLVKKYGDEYYTELYNICEELIPDFKGFVFDKEIHSVRAITGENDPEPEDWDYKNAKTEDQLIEYLNEKYPIAEGDADRFDYWLDDKPKKSWHFEYYDFGYTDDYMLKDWLDKAGITLREFLTNRRYIVICDGDEYCIWDDMKKTGLINMDIIEKEI